MTSSLVGSEMCIRDRVKAQEAMNVPFPPNVLPPSDCVRLAFRNGNFLICLLYTSDAADDM
eukprot:9542341-Prorocentrum_lima.AAC.1